MDIHVPEHLRTGLKTSCSPPSHLNRLLLPGAGATYAAFSGGAVLSQQLREQGFALRTYHFFISGEAVDLRASARMPTNMLHYTLAGSAECVLAPDQQICLSKDKYYLFYVPPCIPHTIHLTADLVTLHLELEPGALELMILADPDVRRLLEHLAALRPEGIKHHAGSVNYQVSTLLQELMSCREEDPGVSSFLLRSRVNALLGLYTRELKQAACSAAAQSDRRQQLEEITRYIHTHIDDRLSLPFLVRHFGLSLRSLHRLFLKHTGKSAADFIFTQRMQHAADLLLHTDMPIGEIGFRVGFDNFSSFERAFTRCHGFPPGKLRRSQ